MNESQKFRSLCGFFVNCSFHFIEFARKHNMVHTRHITKLWLLIAWLCLAASIGNAQLNTLATLERFDEKNGLPFSGIGQILQDQQGYMWFAGLYGVCRYDGYSFKAVTSVEEDSTTIWGNEVYSMALHINGSLLIGHGAGRISILNPRTGKAQRLQVTTEPNTVRAIFCDSKGNIWFAMYGSGVYRFKHNQPQLIGKPHTFPKLADASAIPTLQLFNSFFETKTGTLWVASNNGLYTIAQDSLYHTSHVSNDSKQGLFVHNILSDGDSVFWLPTYGDGIVRYEIKSGRFKSYTFEKGFRGTYNIVYNAAWRNRDELWLTSWGLTSFNIRTRKFSFFYDRKDLAGYLNPATVFCDYNGTVWLATNGITKYAGGQSIFQFNQLKVDKSDNGSGYTVTKVLIDSASQRTILATHLTEGLVIIDKNGNKTALQAPLHPKDEPYQLFYSLEKVRNGKILALNRDMLLELTANNQLIPIKELNNAVPNNNPPAFIRFLETKNGDWLVGSYTNGLFWRQNGHSEWKHYGTDNSSLADDRINGLIEDKFGFIWISHPNAGLSRYDLKKNVWQTCRHIDGDSTSLLNNNVNHIALHRDGTPWVTTPQGVSIFNQKTQKFSPLKLSDGSTLKPSYRLAADDFGNMWVLTAKQLVMVRPDFTFRAFDLHDGLNSDLPSYRIARIGYDHMQLGTYQGYYTFRPSELMALKPLRSPMVITEIRNGNNLLTPQGTEPITINYTNNHISISFSALNYSASKNKYQYRMVNLDDVWSTTSNPTVIYSGMPSGDFTFQAKMVDNPNEIVELPITIATPFFKAWWFRFSLILVGFSGIFLVYRFRLQQIRKEEKLKSDFKQQLAEAETKALKAQMSPHFIFNSLNSINRYIIKAEPEKASLYLTKFSKLIRLILDNSNHRVISLEQEITALKLYIELEALRFNEKFTYSLAVNPALNPMSIGVPPMIIQPFIENAIWHGLLHKQTPGHIDIQIDRFGSGLKCTIVDNGVGRKKAAELRSKSVNKEKSYGMKITNDRLSMLNGESKLPSVDVIDLLDESGNALGTKVIVKITGAELEPEF